MFSKEEKSALNHSFWNEIKNRMKKSSSQLQRRVNWVQYPNHLKHTYLRLVFDKEKAAVCYDIQFKDEEIRVLFWEQLIELKTLINDTMGVSTILKAKRVVLLAWGENKKDVVFKSIESEITQNITASFLQKHKNTTFVLDKGVSFNAAKIFSVDG